MGMEVKVIRHPALVKSKEEKGRKREKGEDILGKKCNLAFSLSPVSSWRWLSPGR
jgi:hypothetical protein